MGYSRSRKSIFFLVFSLLVSHGAWGENDVSSGKPPTRRDPGPATQLLPAQQGPVCSDLPFPQFVQSIVSSVVKISFKVCPTSPFYLQFDPLDDFNQAVFFATSVATSDVYPCHRDVQSGFILSDDGFVVTQFLHGNSAPNPITVLLDDGSRHVATLVGFDPSTGVAVLKINAIHLPAVRMGVFKNMQQWVFAIGRTANENAHIAVGHITAIQSPRNVSQNVAYMDTNMDMLPESTSGLLVDTSGRMLGMLRVSNYDHHVSVLPVQSLKKITHQLQRFGKVVHAYAGFVFEEENPFGKSAQPGVILATTQKSSAAEKAGFKTGDRIIAINGEHISCVGDIVRIIGAEEPGSVVRVEYIRSQIKNTTLIKLGVLPVSPVERRSLQIMQNPHLSFLFLGTHFREMTAQELADKHIPWGLLVTHVPGRSLSERMGIRVGDVLVAMNGCKNVSIHQLKEIFDKNFHDTVTVMIQNGFIQVYVS